MVMRGLQRFFLYLAIILMPIQDCILGKTSLGYVGSNISCIPLAIHGILGLLIWSMQRNLAVSRRSLVGAFYVICISLMYILAWGPVSHGGSVLFKSFSGAVVLLLWIYTLFGIDYTPSKGLRYASQIAFLVMILGVVITDLHISALASLGQSQLFHIMPPSQSSTRWRGFSVEPSMLSATAVSLGFAAAHLSPKKYHRYIIIGLTLILLLLSQSKGGLLVLGISGFVVLFIKRPSFLRLLFYLSLCISIAIGAVFVIIQQLTALDFVQATGTFATRISMAVWSFVVAFHHPFGVGLSGFYEAIRIYLPTAMDWVRHASPVPLNFGEVQEYVDGNMAIVPLDTKCFFFEYVAMFGVPFIIAYVRFAGQTLKALHQHKQEALMVGFIFLIVGMSTYINGPTLYAGFFLAGLAHREYTLTRMTRIKFLPRSHRLWNAPVRS